MGLPPWLSNEKSVCKAGVMGLILGSGRSPVGGHGNQLQYSCLENPHGLGTNREVHVNETGLQQLAHVQDLLIKLLVALCLRCLKGDLLVREQHEVVNEDLGSLLQCVLRVDGTIRRNFKHELVVVGLLLDTIRLHSVLHVTNRSVNRIDCNYINVGAELAILISGYISTTFVNCNINLHRCFGI